MKIYRLAFQNVQEFNPELENFPEENFAEAIRLKNGRIFFCISLNHWPVILHLKKLGILQDQFDAVGFFNLDGTWLTKYKGDSEIARYMKSPGW